MAQRQVNARDPKQVKAMQRQEERRGQRYLDALDAMLNTPLGRIVVWELLTKAGIYGSVYDASGQKMAYNAGRQDFGHELLANCLEANQAGYLLMEEEARRYARGEDSEAAAAHTRAVTDEENPDV